MEPTNGKGKAKPEFKRSLESQLLVEHALKMNVGDIFTYEEMSEVSGRPFPAERYYWNVARTILVKEHKMHFFPVGGEGYQRIPHETNVSTNKYMEHQRRYARRRIIGLNAGNYDELSDTAKFKYNAEMCVQQIQHRAASPKNIKKIEAAMSEQDRKITIKDTLKALGYKGM